MTLDFNLDGAIRNYFKNNFKSKKNQLNWMKQSYKKIATHLKIK